ncbi:NAD-dependent epimerase/dehydratase family protein [Pedobacter sp. MR22-3]|uniref:NAD-dependent epimerase/dehydratase family protein n=1 Tax=Pedobacter sp. MR22-3 TaxID=2994552 RepID=UPI0022481E10|nr:NAD(P)-dependent oxidoreductase [Pedobacter sp. MR22-3]MCX2582893.1 NAD(P)-dependent oxidoreductase [Pedobacter sp. MR22-3]
MNVSLIGTNGFMSNCIGKYCNEQGYFLDVYGRGEPKSHNYEQFFKLDLLSDNLRNQKFVNSDVVIYAAGGGIQFGLKEDVDAIYKLNVSVPISIFNILKDAGFNGTFITFGSYFEIGENIENISFAEQDLISTQLFAPTDYTISKRTLTRFFSSAHANFQFYHFILPTIYGENESKNRLIPYTLNSIYNNVEMKLTSGGQVRQYIYIFDAISLLFNSILANIESGIYNVPGIEEFSVKELVESLFNLADARVPEDIFGKTERADVGMKILKLNADKLLNCVKLKSETKIADVYQKYSFDS